jgi:hypothetical protein
VRKRRQGAVDLLAVPTDEEQNGHERHEGERAESRRKVPLVPAEPDHGHHTQDEPNGEFPASAFTGGLFDHGGRLERTPTKALRHG